MTTYTMMDAMLASPTEPLPIVKRMYQLEIMWQAMENLERSPSPTASDWEAVADALNMMEALRDMGAVEDPDHALEDGVEAMSRAGYRLSLIHI